MTAFLARIERFERVGSTNDVVREWLASGTPEVCVAVAREQTAGRGRAGRQWHAPRDAALLLSLGFRPTWLAPDSVWRLAAVASLAMAEAAEAVADLVPGMIRLKWPNDLVVEVTDAAHFRKLGGVLGETDGLGAPDPRAVVGIGINVAWRATDIPVDLIDTMTSLQDHAAGRIIGPEALLDAFLGRLEPGIGALRTGVFDADSWAARQLTTGRDIRLETPDGVKTTRALGVDTATGALLVADATRTETTPASPKHVHVGDITHVRSAEPIAEAV